MTGILQDRIVANSGSPGPYRFGAFELEPDKRRLLKDGAAIPLRPRAFDLLVALIDCAGRLVTKNELLDRVWPKTVVEEAALHVQVSALRKVLGSEAITTVSGRGYQFTLPVSRGGGGSNHAPTSRMTGAGGVDKTRLAIEVARRLIDALPQGVWLLELAALPDPFGDYLVSKKLLLVLDNVEVGIIEEPS